MRLHLITIGEPKLLYAKEGWHEYTQRLGRYHTVRETHLADKWAYDTSAILKAAANSYIVALAIDGKQFSSEALADFLETRMLDGRELSFIIGGPEGLPQQVLAEANLAMSFSKLTFPHDLAMVILAEALYRASTIRAGHPYHKA